MWTRDKRVFFYNPSEKASLWERPQILMGRNDVDKLVKEPPVTADSSGPSTNVSNTNNSNVSSMNTNVMINNNSNVKKKLPSDNSSIISSTIANGEQPPLKKHK